MKKILTIMVAYLLFLSNLSFGQGSDNALNFDGVNDYVNVPHNANLNLLGNMTIEAWINPTTLTNTHYQGVAGKRTWTGATPWSMMVLGNLSGNTKLIWYSSACCPASTMETLLNLNTNSSIPTGEWTHIAIVVNGTTATGFVNGVQESSGTIVHRAATTGSMVMGHSTSSGTEQFDGRIDEVRVWDVARTQAQIRDNMCKQLAGNETNLVGYWNMNEGTGNTVNDLTSNNNDGTRTQ